MRYYCEGAATVLRETGSTERGLSAAEAALRLEKNGPNKLMEEKKESVIIRFFTQMTDPMIIILLAAAAISGVLAVSEGESFVDVIIILSVVIINAVLGVYQESKAEKAIEALQQMSAATSRVIRNNKTQVIRSEELVVGDIILLEAGDAVPADGRLLENASLKVEEAALTGESVPVTKFIDIIMMGKSEKDIPLGDRKNMVYMGSTICYGRGKAVITATGMSTEMGRIADALANAKEGQTPLQVKLSQLSKILTWLVLGICVVIFAVQIFKTGGFSFDGILNSFMIAVSLAVAAIPEGLAAVVTVVLSIGVTNMSKRNAIIRRLTAVETLGCTQIICSDKTGTLTQNKMTVIDKYCNEESQLACAMALCCDAEIDEMGKADGEPTEAALVCWAYKMGYPKSAIKGLYPRIGEAPFDSGRKLMSTVHSVNNRVDTPIICARACDEAKNPVSHHCYVQFTKGAPDVILDRCTSYQSDGRVVPMTEEYRKKILKSNKEMAGKALRVLACAQRVWNKKPASYEAEYLEQDLCFVGLCGMIDPVRPEVKEAIAQCSNAGINAVMITGDHIDTAIAIARELHILTEDKKAITGAQLNDMSDAEFTHELKSISVYARVQPEHKTRIVNAWRDAGYVTAMTGDGVNDAPSIKSADIGVGMGITGTDVTKSVADMVLTDDNFATIVGAVEEGRRIYDNIRKAIQFLLGSNMSEVISIFVATLLGFTILKPVHLLWINLVTDCVPALALGMEAAEADIMKRKPREMKAGIFAGGMGIDICYQGAMVSILVLASYFIGHYMESGVWEIADSPNGVTMAFLTMSMAEIFHSMNMRSQRGSIFYLKNGNPLLVVAVFLALIATTAVCEIPFMAEAFGFTSISVAEYLVAIGISVCVIPIVEIIKLIQRKLERCTSRA